MQNTLKPLLILASLSIYFFINIFNKSTTHFSFSFFDVLFLSLIGWQGLSTIWSISYIESLNVSINWLTLYILFKFFQHFCSNTKAKNYTIITLITACCISLMIAYTVILYNEFLNLESFSSHNILSVFGNTYKLTKNYISSLFVLFWGVSVYLIIQNNRKIQWFGMLLFFLILIMELLLLSRGGLLLVILIIGTLFVLNFFNKSISWIKLVGLAISCAFLFYAVKQFQANEQVYLSFMDPFYGIKSETGDERLVLWKTTFQLFLENPIFGYGSGSWLYEYMRNGVEGLKKVDYMIHPHNLFIEKLFENGLPGFILCVTLLIFFPVKYFILKLQNKTFSNEDYLWLIGIMCYIINALLYSTVQIGWGNFKGHIFLYIFFLSQSVKLNTIKWSIKNKAFNLILLCLTIFSLGFYANASYLSHHFFQASNYLKKNKNDLAEKHLRYIEQNPMPYCHKGFSTHYLNMQLHLKKSQFYKAEKSIKKQLKIHPYNYNFWFDLGIIYEHQQKIKQAKTAYKQTLFYKGDYISAKIKLLNIGFILKDEKLVEKMTNQLTVIDDYLQLYRQNEAIYQKIEKAVIKRNKFEQLKTQRDSIIIHFNATLP